MHSFKDATGREWRLTVNVGAIKRVRDLAGVDLCDAAGGGLLEKLDRDLVLLVGVLAALVRDSVDGYLPAAAVPAFADAMVGEPLAEASRAFIEELVSFFPSRQRLRMLAALMHLAETHKAEALEAEAEAAERAAAVQSAIPPTVSGSATSSPAGSASTPPA
jgi:hypothetical protein